MKVGLGDVATYASIVAVAIIEAVNETLKLEPSVAASLPGFLTSGFWHFVPLGLLTLVGLIWLGRQIRGKRQSTSSSDSLKATSASHHLADSRVFEGFNKASPSFHAKFARSGRNGVFYLDYSMGVNPEQWTQRRSIQIRRVDRFALGEDISFPIVSRINVRGEDRWYFGLVEDLDATGWPKDVLGPSCQYRGCVKFLSSDDTTESCYFIVFGHPDTAQMPDVTGEHMFAHMFAWEGLPTRHGAH